MHCFNIQYFIGHQAAIITVFVVVVVVVVVVRFISGIVATVMLLIDLETKGGELGRQNISD